MAAQLNAAASGSALSGALGMFAFGLGTAPLMLGFGTASSLIPKRFKERAMVLLAVVVLVFGVTYLNRGAMLLGSPVTLQSVKSAVLGQGETGGVPDEYVTGADGVVEVPLVIENTRFVPATVNVPADVPVRLVVDRREADACSDQIALPQLGVLEDLAPNGITQVMLPATKAGTYTLTCGMGMMSGQLVVGDAGGSAGGSRGLLAVLGLLAAGLAVAGVVLVRTAPADGRKTVAGLAPHELLFLAAAVVAAVIAGLYLGGNR